MTATDSDDLSATQRMLVAVTDGAIRLTRLSNNAVGPGWSPDGAKIAYTSWEELFPPSGSYLRVMDADGRIILRGGGGLQAPVWFPDGAKIAAVSASAIHLLNADLTGETRLVTRGNSVPDWSPDFTKVAIVGSTGEGSDVILLVHVDGSSVTGTTRLAATGRVHVPSWSPDGTKIAFVDHNFDHLSNIYVMNADGSGETRLAYGTGPSWSPDGTKIAFRRFVSTINVGGREGRLYSIFVMNADGSGVTQLTPASDFDRGSHWSPDGTRIVFSSIRYGDDGRANESGIFVMNADGSGVTRLTTDFEPRGYHWSPDGTKIAFSAQRDDDDDYQIYVMDVPATGNSVGLSSDAPEQPPFERTPPRR